MDTIECPHPERRPDLALPWLCGLLRDSRSRSITTMPTPGPV